MKKNYSSADTNRSGGIDWSESVLGKAVSRLFGDAKEKILSAFRPTRPQDLIDPTAIRGNITKVMPQTPAKTPQVTAQPQINAIMPSPTATKQPLPTPTPLPRSDKARNPAFPKFKVQPIVDNAIQSAASEFGVPASLLYDIALQESGFRPDLKNPSPTSSASGLFQFTKGTWDTVKRYAQMPGSSLKGWTGNEDRFDPFASARAAAYLIKVGQLARWDASKDVWGPYYQPEELRDFYKQSPKP